MNNLCDATTIIMASFDWAKYTTLSTVHYLVYSHLLLSGYYIFGRVAGFHYLKVNLTATTIRENKQ